MNLYKWMSHMVDSCQLSKLIGGLMRDLMKLMMSLNRLKDTAASALAK